MPEVASDFVENLVFNFVKFPEGAHPHHFLGKNVKSNFQSL